MSTPAIVVRFVNATNTKGTRVKATCHCDSITVGYDYALSTAGNERAAAEALVAKLDWPNAELQGPFDMPPARARQDVVFGVVWGDA